MIKVMLIAPYSGLAETAKKIQISNEFDVTIKVANLEQAITVAQNAEKDGYDLIITRGGTASLIQQNVSIPVVHIDISGYDMLRVFTLIREIKTGVALVGFSNILLGASTICNLLGFNVKLVTIQSRTDVKHKMEQLKKESYTVVIGDVVTVEVAEQLGMRGVLITSGKEALLDAFEESKRMHNLFHNLNKKLDFMKNTFKDFPYPLILVDKKEDIIYKNNVYEQQISHPELITSQQVLQQIKRTKELNTNQWEEISISSHHYSILSFPLLNSQSGVGLIIHNTKLKSFDTFQIISSTRHAPLLGKSPQIQRLQSAVERFSYGNDSVCIVGEIGTGKETLARIIHFKKFNQSYPLIYIDGNNLNKMTLNELQSKSFIIQQGSVILKNVHAIDPEIQKDVLNFIQHIPSSIRILSTTNQSLNKMVHEGIFHENLYKKITETTIHISPLRERKEDIPELSNYFLAEFHKTLGTETLGITPEAMAYLKKLNWVGNVIQLKQVIREASIMSPDHYISLSLIKSIIDQIKEIEYKNIALPINGTLEEIERQIIEQVLKEEKNNQSKAAERLGINRTTLWRKLNK